MFIRHRHLIRPGSDEVSVFGKREGVERVLALNPLKDDVTQVCSLERFLIAFVMPQLPHCVFKALVHNLHKCALTR